MNPRVVAAEPLADFVIEVTFTNGERRRFDVKPYLRFGVFRELADPDRFRAVRVSLGTVAWAGGQDLCPDTLYEGSSALDPPAGAGTR
ncbi:MAG: DUF2442 domain-containing protein [Deltaproteobacteria bacterium]|nr:DUF2442 domain-containing protein [Deltaproteobacteria bacterium]